MSMVSVIMPVYNAADTIEQAVWSVLKQTHRNLELLIVDDASIDNTLSVVASFDDPRIELLRLDRNGGPGAARNAALDIARGDWVTLIDADDLWDTRRIEVMLRAGNATGCKHMVTDDIVEFFETPNGRREGKPVWHHQLQRHKNHEEISLERYLSLRRTVMQPLVPRAAIERAGIRYSSIAAAEDFEFYIRLFKQADLRLLSTCFTGYYYRMTPGSLSANPQRSIAQKEMLKNLLGELDFNRAEKEAIETRLSGIERHIRYIPFLEAIRAGRLGKALSLAISQPWFIGEFLRRLPGTAPYRLSVWLRGGLSR